MLIPNKEMMKQLSVPRLISLNNFLNKAISKVLLTRITKVIPMIISPNQSGVVKGKSILENVLLA